MAATSTPRLLGPAEVRSLAAALDLRPTKQRGQNFVIDANTVRRIVRDSGISEGDVVIEVNGVRITSTRHLAEICSEELRAWEVVIERRGRIIRSQFRA